MDVKDLLDRLRDQQASSHSRSASAAKTNYQPPTVSSPLFSPSIQTPEPKHGDVLSLNVTSKPNTPIPAAGAAPPDRTNTLLNLLKFNAPNTAAHPSTGAAPPVVASSEHTPAMAGSPASKPSTSANQDMLLNLLKRQTPAQSPAAAPASSKSTFNFVSPFEQLAAASPRNATPQPDPTITITQDLGSIALQENIKPTEAPPTRGESVSDALQDIAQQASNDVDAALHNTAAVTSRKQPTKSSADVADSWETYDKVDNRVQVFNFPMKPFVSIRVNSEANRSTLLRNKIVMKIASLKKPFDQVDRSLTTASSNFIVYAMVKAGGFRVIRQDDGANKVFNRADDAQIFNLAMSSESSNLSSTPEAAEAVIGTAVNGAVYWTSIPTAADSFEDADLFARGFVFPPAVSQEDPTSTAQLKTRAKMSSRHPEFFAIGRGKSIHIIWPNIAASSQFLDSKNRHVLSDKYFAERSLKIATGKAGKDFAFSQDDTTLVSLDKVGRLKFWDITQHTKPENGSLTAHFEPVEVKVPALTLWAASPTEKSSPTSVVFVDKERAMAKGYALRYLLVGMKQNHTIQLWDLGLGKAVQEINLPHENDNDAICSIAYHARTGVIIIGHPTRNSVYLIHLSAPKYNLSSSLTQASYISKLASDDKLLPRPESTAIMSGMRELSFSEVGQLRSLDVLNPLPSDKDDDEDTLFELYAMLSSGVSCFRIKQRDLGWGFDGKVIAPFDAQAEGLITVEALVQPSVSDATNGDVQPETSKPPSQAASKQVEKQSTPVPEPTPSKSFVKDAESSTRTTPAPAPATYASAAQKSANGSEAKALDDRSRFTFEMAAPKAVGSPSPQPDKLQSQTPQSSAALDRKFEELYDRIASDKRIMEASHNARQDAIMRLVSSTLTDNTEKSLDRIVNSAVESKVLPSIQAQVKSALESQLRSVPHALSTSLQQPQTLKTISEQIHGSLLPEITKLIDQSAKQVATEIEARVAKKLNGDKSSAKIDELTEMVRALTGSFQSLSESHAQLLQQISALEAKLSASSASVVVEQPPLASANSELDTVKSLIADPSTVEDGLVKWLQSPVQDELFDAYVVGVNKAVIQHLSPVVGLSILAYVSTNLEKQSLQRIDWLQAVLRVSDFRNPEVTDYAPRVLDLVTTRLQEFYMQVSEGQTGSAILPRIHATVRMLRDHRSLLGA